MLFSLGLCLVSLLSAGFGFGGWSQEKFKTIVFQGKRREKKKKCKQISLLVLSGSPVFTPLSWRRENLLRCMEGLPDSRQWDLILKLIRWAGEELCCAPDAQLWGMLPLFPAHGSVEKQRAKSTSSVPRRKSLNQNKQIKARGTRTFLTHRDQASPRGVFFGLPFVVVV